ncbi:M-phase phosphoprotein 9 isoform X2 [Hemitrygon akajei]|uniref:M-phase phosphoprotein 9 isoform X2 n=1 Tax=Hemitrygon akajei TaxID=2704970 RepID=UPI003BF9A7AB
MEDSDSESVRTVKELPDDTAPKPAARRDNSGGPSAEAANRFYFQEHLKKNLLSINPSALQTLETLMQEIQNTSRADPEILKSCELRWLQLFKLVEKQYQDQILSQQDQYHCQIQLIQDEIKALIQLQNEGGVKHSTAKFPSTSKHMDDLTGCDTVNGHHVEELRHSDCGKAKGQLPATSQCTDEEIQLQDSMELNCASEQNNFPSFDAINEARLNTLDNTQTMKEKDSMQFQQNQFSLPHLKENGHQAFISAAGDKHSFTLKFSSKPVQDLKINQEASNSKSEMEIKMETESQLGKQNNANGLTSWVQKVKQKNWKSKSGTRASCDTMQPQGTRQLQETETAEGVHLPSARSSPNCSFYLSRPSSSPNSLVSSVSGLSYWKMDEGELYHALPNNKETDVLSPSKTVKALRLPAGEIPSLKEIYCMKQRDRKHLSGWGSCSPPLLRSPPQVLTLDPTLHMKRPTPFSPHDHCSTPVVVSECDTPSSISPDSLVGVTTQSYCHPNLGSCVRTAPESELTDTSRYTVRNSSLPSPNWNLHSGTQSSTAVQGQHYLNLKETGNASALAGQEGNSTITPSPVPCVELRSGNSMNRSLDHNVPASSLEDPVMLSVARLNLREKHARHVADIRAYYEAEISSLKEKLDALSSPSAVSEAEKQNQNLSKRCEQLEGALTEAAKQIRDLENKNYLMEMQLAEWPGRYDAVSTAAKALQQRLDEMRKDNKEKDNMVNKLNSRLKDLEEAFERAYKHSDNKDARLKQEHKMLQDLLTEYESLGKEHERVKGALNTTEDKLYDANSQISELKRVVSKLEAQIRQADHERSYMKVRTGAESCLRTSNNRYHSPPEKDHPFSQQDSSEPNPPILRALKQLDSRKSSENWGVQAQLQDVSGAGDSTKVLKRTQALGFVDSSCSKSQSVDLYKGRTRSKGNSSPSGQRSSSVPPSSRKSTPTSTPTKRNTLLTSLSAKSSPKRCPKENLSPGFNHLLGKEENPVTRFDINLDEDDFAESVPSCGSSPRKRLQFFPLENTESRYHVDNAQRAMPTDSVLNAVKMGSIISRPAWEDKTITSQKEKQNAALQTPYETELTYKARMEALGETEKLFDALTQEKQQIEAALSRIPGSTGRMTLQARLEKEALEDRLEKINRDLGSVRMTLKRFHILRTSANL